MEYWLSRITQSYILADTTTGDLVENDSGTIVEFTSEAALLAEYPGAALSTHMGG